MPFTKFSTRLDPTMAAPVPAMPPIKVMNIVSAKTILPMSRPEAPMAFIIPNSRVLSLTDISSVLIMPKALMINAMAITVRSKERAEPARFIIVPMI